MRYGTGLPASYDTWRTASPWDNDRCSAKCSCGEQREDHSEEPDLDAMKAAITKLGDIYGAEWLKQNLGDLTSIEELDDDGAREILHAVLKDKTKVPGLTIARQGLSLIAPDKYHNTCLKFDEVEDEDDDRY